MFIARSDLIKVLADGRRPWATSSPSQTERRDAPRRWTARSLGHPAPPPGREKAREPPHERHGHPQGVPEQGRQRLLYAELTDTVLASARQRRRSFRSTKARSTCSGPGRPWGRCVSKRYRVREGGLSVSAVEAEVGGGADSLS
jgi:hypothetical protein